MSASRLLGAVLAVAMTCGIAWLSRVPTSFSGPDEALIRLSWRIDGVSMEECRELTEEDLAALPVHMRNPDACIGRIAPYLLEAHLDGRLVVRDTVFPGGARGDRPIYVFSDLSVPTGHAALEVRFEAIVPEGVTVPPDGVSFRWSGDVDLGSGDVVLVTLDDAGRLVVRTPRQGRP